MQAPDPILVLRAQAGDRDALDELLRICQGPLHRYIASVVGDASAAEDVTQECLFRIARKLRWLSEPALFRAWAFRIASREAQRSLARRRNLDPLDDAADASVEADGLKALELEALRNAVATLSPASRAVLSLHYFEDMTLNEIADVLEIPLGTVKSRLGYGIRQLRMSMGDR
jgi:RNA polymerase sigma-70 factor (ECF subfamily)